MTSGATHRISGQLFKMNLFLIPIELKAHFIWRKVVPLPSESSLPSVHVKKSWSVFPSQQGSLYTVRFWETAQLPLP